MAYSDDQLRAQRHTLPKSKIGMSDREMLLQKKILSDIVDNNKKVMEKGAEAEVERARVITKETLRRFEKTTGIDQKDSDRKTQEVIDYFDK